jgi:tetratricopeptide (TPR) repeat protein
LIDPSRPRKHNGAANSEVPVSSNRASLVPLAFGLSRFVGLIIWVTLAVTVAAQQEPAPGIRDPFNQPDAPGRISREDLRGATLMVSVKGVHGPLEHQAVVKLSNKQTSVISWQATRDKSEAAFSNLAIGSYAVEVDAAGFFPAHRDFNIQTALTTYAIELALTPDPSSIDFIEIPSDSDIPAALRKHVNRALDALRSGDLTDAQKQLKGIAKSAPSSADVSFFLGYLALEQHQIAQAQAHLTRATELNPRQIRALILLGKVLVKNGDYAKAAAVLQRAVALNNDYSLPHELLSEAYLRDKEFAKARDQAELAVKSEGDESNAQIILGEALANLGQQADAIAALNAFLQASPASPLATQVRNLLTEVQGPHLTDRTKATKSVDKFTTNIADALVTDTEPAGGKWQPPGIDDLKPPVVPNISCPQQQVIELAGAHVREFVNDISQFAAVEEILHEQLDAGGRPITKLRRNFNYVASISQTRPGEIMVDEDRIGRTDLGDFPDQIATRGLPTLALIFHPDLRDDYEMTCEGLGDWKGQATWLVHFRQRDDRPKRVKGYKLGEEVHPVGLKGRAWISADTYQIVRIESELVNPIPEIRLLSDHQIVEYGAVTFAKKNTTLWLPKSAELYFELRKRRYYRRHSFSDFLLFAVDSNDKALNPPVSKDQAETHENNLPKSN